AVDLIKNEEVRNEFIGGKVETCLIVNPATAFENRREIGHMLNISHEAAETLNSNFNCMITDIEIFQKAEVDEELFKKVFGEEGNITTEKQFLERLRDSIGEQLSESSDRRFEIDARETLVENISMELPEEFLKRWLKATDKEMDDEKVAAQFEDFIYDLKWQLIKSSIVKENKLEATKEDIDGMAFEMAKAQLHQYGLFNIDDNTIQTFANRITENEESRERLIRRILDVETFDVIKEKAKVDETSVTIDEFKELYGNYEKENEEIELIEDEKETGGEKEETASQEE
ncbi:MAG: hypothetical protein FWG22_03425, partial [Prolixibacteraceae bacterium]|nr:hypothetical protein [Prolixibacteraceae bacterium]